MNGQVTNYSASQNPPPPYGPSTGNYSQSQPTGGPYGGSSPPVPGGSSTPTSVDRTQAVVEATARINNFKTSTFAGKWNATLDRKSVADRLIELVNNPDLANQGGDGLCGEAAFFNIWLWDDPLAVSQFAMQLYNGGAAAIGTQEWVRPRPELMAQDFSKVAQMFLDRNSDYKKEDVAKWGADWMMMSALRDANNWIISYDGTPTDEWGGGSSDGEVARWLRATNHFASVGVKTDSDEEHNYNHASKLQPGNNIILISCESHMLGNRMKAKKPEDDHWFVLRSSIIESSGTVDFRFWCWGEPQQWVNDRRQGLGLPPLPKQQFTNEYFGYLIANR